MVLEVFGPADENFFRGVRQAIPHYNIQMSAESHDEEVRRAFGKGWRNVDIEETIKAALENDCRRFDLFYMIGLAKQDRKSVMGTVDYSVRLMKEFGGKSGLHPHISPLAPKENAGLSVRRWLIRWNPGPRGI